MEDPRDVFTDTLDIGKSRINTSKSPIVLLCGGEVPDNYTDSDPNASLRHAVVRQPSTSKFELFRPEEITSWQADAIFKNLVQFEVELSAVCTIIVLIVESPGSIAELGAFSQQKELQEKLMVMKSSEFIKPSFIQLGILRDIEESKNNIFPCPVNGFPWTIDAPQSIDPEVTVDVLAAIEEGLKSVKKTEVISDNRSSHTTTIIRELIRIFVALKVSEISAYLDKLNIFVPAVELNRKLFLLEKFKLVKPVEYGSTYYCSTMEEYNTLRLSPVDGKRLDDATTISIECFSYYLAKKDRHRLGAIKAFKKGGGR